MLGKRQDERGSALIMTAAAMVCLLGFAALAVDGGSLYFKHTKLQDIADSAALAAGSAAARVVGDQMLKRSVSLEAVFQCVEANGLQIIEISGNDARVLMGTEVGQVSVTFPEDSKIQVNLSLSADLFFARAISRSTAELGVSSVAYVSQEARGIVPIAFFRDGYASGTQYDMTLTSGDGVSGNYGFLDYRPPNLLEQFLTEGYHGGVAVGDLISTYPGMKVGRIKQAMDERLGGCTHGCTHESFVPGCPRVVVIPTVSDFYEASGRSYVTVTGFVKFFIDAYDSKGRVLKGWCLGPVSENEANSVTGIVQHVKLVDR
ncbi:MAG: pilus assembly protein TadG-related protein [Bacillota bacterium]|jgi:hypothetical protein